jgi:hypothetical protein
VAEGFGDGPFHFGLLGLVVAGEGFVDDGEFLSDVPFDIEGVFLSADAEGLADGFIYLLEQVLLFPAIRLYLYFALPLGLTIRFQV